MSVVINSSGSDWQPCLFLDAVSSNSWCVFPFLPSVSKNLWDVREFKLLKEMTSAPLLLFNYPQLGSFHIHEQHTLLAQRTCRGNAHRRRVLALKTWMCKSDELAMCVHNMAASLAGGAGGRLGRVTRNCATSWCSHLSGFSLTVPSGTQRFVVSYHSNCSQMFMFCAGFVSAVAEQHSLTVFYISAVRFTNYRLHFLFLYVQRTCLWIYSQSGAVFKNTAQHSLQCLFKYDCSCPEMINLCKLLLPMKVFY